MEVVPSRLTASSHLHHVVESRRRQIADVGLGHDHVDAFGHHPLIAAFDGRRSSSVTASSR